MPTYIVDAHNHAYYGWHEAVAEGLVERGSTLLHVDQHGDYTKVGIMPSGNSSLYAAGEVARHLHIYDFISAAMNDGLIGEVIWIHPFHSETQFSCEPQKIFNIGYQVLGIDSPRLLPYLRGDIDRRKIIGDIDLDYFNPMIWELDYVKRRRDLLDEADLISRDLSRVKQLVANTGVNTIATSPTFINQLTAIDLARQISK